MLLALIMTASFRRQLIALSAVVFAMPLLAQSDTHPSLPLEKQFLSADFSTTPAFSLNANPLVIRRVARANQPFSVSGERGAILGQQDGTFELWLLPVKVLHDVHLTARIAGYDAAIDLNAQASSVEVRPDHTTITYSHAAITVKQHMFTPRDGENGMANAVVLFEVHAIRAADITLSFSPSLERQWPAPNFGRPDGSWVPAGSGGAFLLQTDNPNFFGAVAMPQATHGGTRPYQERPLTQPLSFTFHYDPAKDDGRFYPLLCSVVDPAHAGNDRGRMLAELFAEPQKLSQQYKTVADFYGHFFDTHTYVSTPDARLNDALKWAAIAIEESKVSRADGAGLAAGWFTSGDSARPGFGWFFGRDTLWTLFAVNSFGDFNLSRQAMNFLLTHQRDDGKMMHEYSQEAESVDWTHLPYLYAAADSTPLFVMEMDDYVRQSGDVSYLKSHWDNVKRAWSFTRAHTTDGIYDNSQGTGWVEEWVPTKPHQEIYLAALDEQSSAAMARMAKQMGDAALASQAAQTAEMIRGKLAAYRGADGMYAFNRRVDGSYENIATVFPSVAWWDGTLTLPKDDATFATWASHSISTDWGTRSVAEDSAVYEPISYHHGSVWPLYTGWVSLAEYRTHRSLSAYQHLRQNMELTWLQDPGAVTELLSGAYYQPLGRSSSHQLWSSAMVFTPALRGLFGLEADAETHTLRVAPQLPAEWDEATVHNVAVGDERYTVTMRKQKGQLLVEAASAKATELCLAKTLTSAACAAKAEAVHRMTLPLPAVEVALEDVVPAEGAATEGLKVLEQTQTEHGLTLKLEGLAGHVYRMRIRKNIATTPTVTGADVQGDALTVRFDGAHGYQQKAVELRW